MTRIVAGSAGGRALKVPRAGTRPTSDRVREAIFSRLEHEGAVAGVQVLDLYCGSGALGLEAVSRGAQRAVLVDNAPTAVSVARENASDLGFGAVDVIRMDVIKYLTRLVESGSLYPPGGLILCDPPYDLTTEVLHRVLQLVDKLIDETATVVVERSSRSVDPTWPAHWVMATRSYGDTTVFIGGPCAPPGVPERRSGLG